ncbi:hypothetical protein [Defluviimonas sp. SAOS-178_SWC]|uniref:hypothetical protein n=1 Tax=Defluviimonas sp. SAOS-178_SWC TaxID=3121287 RepID=UPI0032220C96
MTKTKAPPQPTRMERIQARQMRRAELWAEHIAKHRSRNYDPFHDLAGLENYIRETLDEEFPDLIKR